MKKIIITILVVLCVGGGIFGFWYVQNHSKSSVESDEDLTEVQKITTMDLEKNYPETPRAVVKLFNRILKSYYDGEYNDEEFKELTQKAWELFDAKLQANNGTAEEYQKAVKAEADSYKDRNRTISQTDVCDSDKVQYVDEKNTETGKKDKIAYVSASYFVKEGISFTNTYEKYVLRKDENGKWKILVFYQIEKNKNTEEE